MNQSPSAIIIISTGPGGESMITPEAREAIDSCDIVFGTNRLVEVFAQGRKTISPSPLVTGTIEAIEREMQNDGEQTIGVLVSGDAGFFSLTKAITERFGAENIRRIPGITSMQAAFARIGRDWQDARTFSAHGRNVDFMAELGGIEKAAVLTDRQNTADILLSAHPHLITTHDVWVVERVSLPDERITYLQDETVLQNESFDGLAVIILVRRPI